MEVLAGRRRKEKPLYVQIAEELKSEILEGRFQNKEHLPPVKQLTEEMAVSRSTLREAIGILESKGLVKRIHGVGTLITKSQIGMERLRSYTDSIKARGMEPGTCFKELIWEKADNGLADALQVEEGSKVAVINRVRTGDGKPMIYTVDKIDHSIIGLDFALDQLGESLFKFLKEEKGVELNFCRLIVKATGVDEEIAPSLDLKPDDHVLSVEEVYYDPNSKPLLYSVNIYRTDRYFFQVIGR